jgi:hypothetical protein
MSQRNRDCHAARHSKDDGLACVRTRAPFWPKERAGAAIGRERRSSFALGRDVVTRARINAEGHRNVVTVEASTSQLKPNVVTLNLSVLSGVV